MTVRIPHEMQRVREDAQRALGRLKPVNETTNWPDNFLIKAIRSEAGRQLPSSYLVYLLLVDLLGFRNLGKYDKVAWSVPIDLDGQAFIIEHRKFGLGLFVSKLPEDEVSGAEVVELINLAKEVAQPYFLWRGEQAASSSKLNVNNRSRELYSRLRYFIDAATEKIGEADKNKIKFSSKLKRGGEILFPSQKLLLEAQWLRLAAVENFFSWTEHVFIHIAILNGKISTGNEVAKLSVDNWSNKYKMAIENDDCVSKDFYDEFILLRRKVRNFVAHGSFGKDGEALSFHSEIGAVPMMLTKDKCKSKLVYGEGQDIKYEEAICLIERFIKHLWSGSRAPAKLYIQESRLPLILTYANNGKYKKAMHSIAEMGQLIDELSIQFDQYIDMDF